MKCIISFLLHRDYEYLAGSKWHIAKYWISWLTLLLCNLSNQFVLRQVNPQELIKAQTLFIIKLLDI